MFQEKTKKKLIIVCNEKTKVYATHLMQLISANDERDGKKIACKDASILATVWDEKKYIDNEPTLSSDQDIIFVGRSKASKSAIAALEEYEIFYKYGIRLSRHGNMATIVVDDTLLEKDEYDEFLEFCKKNEREFKSKVKLTALSSAKNSIKGFALLLPHTRPIAIYGFIVGNKAKKQIIDQQYRFGVFYFYINELVKFLEE